MKKIIAAFFVHILLISMPLVAFAHTDDLDFYDALENHGSVILITEPQTGNILYANKAAADFYGYSTAELESMNLQDLNTLTSEETKKEMQDISENIRHDFELEHKLANGEIRTVEIKSYPYNAGDRTLIIGIVNDITRRIQLEKREQMYVGVLLGLVALLFADIFLLIRNSGKLKARYKEISNFNELKKTFIDSYDDLIYLKDENFRYVFTNRELEYFYSKKENEIVGHEDFELIDNNFAEVQRKSDIEVLKTKTLAEEEISWNSRTYKAIKFPVKLLNGKYGVGAYVYDVTEANQSKKVAEKNLQRNQILVDVLSKDFDSTQEQLDYALNESLKLTESKFGYIYLYNEESREFVLNSWSKDVMAECTIVEKMAKYQLEKTGLWGEVIRQRKPIIVNNYDAPNAMKKGYPEGHVQLTRFMSVPVVIEDKIVAVAGLANKEHNYDNNDVYEIITLMNGIWNAKERREALVDLAIERNRFLQTLISIGDGVLVVNMEGKVAMLNKAAEKLTGWTSNEAFGRQYKEVFVLSHEDEKCTINDPIQEVMKLDTVRELGNHAMLTSKDGTRYYLEDSAAPIKDDKNNTTGIVLVFRDVTEKKEQRQKIEYLSFHDSLTGLYNRIFFNVELERLDTERNLPLSVIVGDMNGLKLTNDIFGHEAGDLLLQKLAEVFKKICRADDIIARVGGDEFTLLLPKTTADQAEEIISRVKDQFSKERVEAIKGSVSMGCDTKMDANDNITQILKNAENKMYSSKVIDRKDIKESTIKTVIEKLHKDNPNEADHSRNISEICENIGFAVNLPEVEIRRAKEAGYLHDIGKITLSKNLIAKNENLTEQQQKEMNQHPITGYRILNSFDNTLDLAESILAHHEKWDGSGFPKGLKGEEIPMLARIIAVAESYDAMTNGQNCMSRKEALDELEKKAGTEFDPAVVNVLSTSYLTRMSGKSGSL